MSLELGALLVEVVDSVILVPRGAWQAWMVIMGEERVVVRRRFAFCRIVVDGRGVLVRRSPGGFEDEA